MIPNHVLVIGPPHSGKLRIAQEVGEETELPPDVSDDTHSGLIFRRRISTRYFSTKLNILVDEYPERRVDVLNNDEKVNALRSWCSEFVSEEMKELRDALDGILFCLDSKDGVPHLEQCLDVLSSMRDVLTPEDAYAWPGFILVVIPDVALDDEAYFAIDEAAITRGFECISLKEKGFNEYKERLGRDRLREVFESHEWTNLEKNNDNGGSNEYEERKAHKLKNMTEPLLSSDAEDNENKLDTMELADLLQRLSVAKETAAGMQSSDKKEAYVQKVIGDIINFI